MRNLQYEMKICQKSQKKVTKTVYVWFEFYGSDVRSDYSFWWEEKIIFYFSSLKNKSIDANKTYIDIGNGQKFDLSKLLFRIKLYR